MQALMAAVGFGNTGGDIFERGGPYLVRGARDLIPPSKTAGPVQPRTVLHHPQLRTDHAQSRRMRFGGNGYSLNTNTQFLGAENPYVYPDNLPRVNAQGGPGGRRVAGSRSPGISGPRRTW